MVAVYRIGVAVIAGPLALDDYYDVEVGTMVTASGTVVTRVIR